MATIQKIGFADFERLLAAWEPRRRIDAVHLRHTRRPRRIDFVGKASIDAMRRYHVEYAGLRDLAQHLTIDPDGGLWTGRPFDQPPASVGGGNGDAIIGPFMIVLVGDFGGEHGDRFGGEQKITTESVIVALLRKFDLKTNDVRFLGDLGRRTAAAEKSMLGTSAQAGMLKQKKFFADIEAQLSGGGARHLRKQSDALMGAAEIRSWSDAARDLPMGHGADVEPSYAEIPETDWALAQLSLLSEQIENSGSTGRSVDDGLRALLPHVINLSKGVLSSEGKFSTEQGPPSAEWVSNRSSLRRIVEQYLPAYIEGNDHPHIVFYAHGGLVDEAAALCYAKTILPWWLENGVYPIFFVWESSWVDALRNKPRGIGEWWDKVTDKVTDATDFLAEGISQWAARRIWREIKEDAENASNEKIQQYGCSGGAYLLAEMLRPTLRKYREKVNIHAIGHSTGPILLAKFLPQLIGSEKEFEIKTLSYLAPAIRIDRFVQDVMPMIGTEAKHRIRDFAIYTMTDVAERRDNVACLYRKSLLYFVREACEDLDNGKILGIADDLMGDGALRVQFGIGNGKPKLSYSKDSFSIEFSPHSSEAGVNSKTSATKHGQFDNDTDTMTAVLDRILSFGGQSSSRERQVLFPTKGSFENCRLSSRQLMLAQARPVSQGNCKCKCNCCCCCKEADSGSDRFGDDVEAGDGEDHPKPVNDVLPISSPSPGSSNARKLALCIGIDSYAGQPLSGCVNDSNRWADALNSLGFTVTRIVDRDATRAAILQGLRSLIAKGREGDELVFQYAGHGTQVEDDDNDEADGFDEAFVPIDYNQGRLLLDDDFHKETEALRRGAHLTMFMDCCHSGSNSRFAPTGTGTHRRGSDERVRFMRLGDDAKRRFFATRKGRTGRARDALERMALPGVVHFAACRDNEYAWESNGQGDFTGIATPLLLKAAREGVSNQAFIASVVKQFGSQPRQHPLLLKPAQGLSARSMFGGA